MRAVLVTGASGTVGSEVVSGLSASGVPVKAAFSTTRNRAVPAGAEPVEFDFERPETFGAALEGVDRVFLMRPPRMSDAAAFMPFIDAMVRRGVAHVVFLSVQGAGQNIFVPHNRIERMLKKSGLVWTFLRPSFFMENLTTTHCPDIRDRDEIFVPAGRGRTNFVAAADVGEAAVVCLTTSGHEKRAYEITGTEALTYHEVAAILSSACGREITYPAPSAKQFRSHMGERGFDNEYVSVMSSIYAIARFGMAAGTTDTFERFVGRRPESLARWAERNTPCWMPEA